MRKKVIGDIGQSRKFNTLMKKLRKERTKRRYFLKSKYKDKIIHLDRERLKELEEKQLERKLPDEISEYNECKIFNMNKAKQLRVAKVDRKLIGNVIVDTDELSILQLNPKFCIMKRLIDEEMIMTKLRYEIRSYIEKKEREKENTVETDRNKRKRLYLNEKGES